MGEYDRSLRLNEALMHIFSDKHPELEDAARIAVYNHWNPTAEDVNEPAFMVDNRIILTSGLRETVNGEIPVYFSSRLTERMNGMPVFVPYVPHERTGEVTAPAASSTHAQSAEVAYADSF